MEQTSKSNHATTPEQTAAKTKAATFLALPTELKIQVVESLGVRDIKNLRLVSYDWANVGAPGLFKDGFTVRPHLPDMARLEAVCQRPEFAMGIKRLKIYAGDVDKSCLEQAIDETLDDYNRPSPRDIKVLSGMIASLYDPAMVAKHCSQDILERLFRLLPSLTAVTTTSIENPFLGVRDQKTRKLLSPRLDLLLNDVWEYMENELPDEPKNNFFQHELSISRYSASILATLQLQTPLQQLDLHPLPIECFIRNPSLSRPTSSVQLMENMVVDQEKLEQMELAVARVNTLSITLVGSGNAHDIYTEPNLARAVAGFIGSMKELRKLNMKWHVDEELSDDFIKTWHETFYENMFPQLEDLILEDMEDPPSVVSSFIFRHGSTLKRLRLGESTAEPDGYTLEDEEGPESCRQMLTEYKEKCPNLQAFEYGEMSGDRYLLYDSEWNSLHHLREGRLPDGKLLELFVLGKCPWPMTTDSPNSRGRWHPKFAGTDLKFLDMSPEELKNLLGDDWETDQDSDQTETDSEMDLDASDFDDSDDSDDFDDDDMDIDDETPVPDAFSILEALSLFMPRQNNPEDDWYDI